MRRFVILLFLSLSITDLCLTQERPIFFGEDNDENSNFSIHCLCRPGVQNKTRSRGLEIAYIRNAGGAIRAENGFLTGRPSRIDHIENLIFKLKLPLVNTEGVKVLAGFTYRPEKYYFDTVGVDYAPIFRHINGQNLKNTGFEVFGTKSFNDRHYGVLRVKASFNGDYNGLASLRSQYAIYNVTSVFGVKKSDDLEYGFGLTYTSSFRNTTILPFLVYNRNFSEKWGIESVLPALAVLRYNFSPNTILTTGFRYNSRSYSLDVPDNNRDVIYEMNHSEVRFLLSAEKRLVPWIWLDAEVGYQLNFSTDFTVDELPEASFQVENDNNIYFKIGLFLSPPDSFMK